MSSQAYTPGLKITENFIINKTRRLPIKGKVLVKKGDIVEDNKIVAITNIPGDPYILNVSGKLGIDPETINSYMLKKAGDSVEKNENIAYYKAFFGLIKKACISPTKGTLEHISNLTGQVIVRGLPVKVEIKAYIPGIVKQIIPEEGVIIQNEVALIQGIFGIGGETNGEIMVITNSYEDVVDENCIKNDCRGGILIGGSLITPEALRKAVDVGAKGVVVGGMNEIDLINFLGYNIGVAITGQEQVGITLILTEGFGRISMREKTFELFKKFEGKKASINGSTQIRAGVLRPEIIIPTAKKIDGVSIDSVEEEISSEGLKTGTIIRLIEDPYLGTLGKVDKLPVELQKIETESNVRVLIAELSDGRIVTVPRANVEIIEE